jgi:CHAT domain-containing protein/tetratricopeptide (TPR) repeat protein
MQTKTKQHRTFALIICGLFLLSFSRDFAASANERSSIQAIQTAASSCATKGEAELLPLERDAILEREITLKESHCYKLALHSGQYLRVIVEQIDIDAVLTFFAPDNTEIATIDRPNGFRGFESISLIAKTSGAFFLRVMAAEGCGSRGRYRVRIAELRDATSKDESRLSAEKLVAEGEKLRSRKEAECYKKAIEKFEQARILWGAFEDRYEQAVALYGLGLSYRSLGENQRAEQSFSQSLLLMRETGDRYGEATAQMGLAYAFMYLGENRRSLENFLQCLKIRKGIKDKYGEALTLHGIAWAYSLLEEQEKALEHFFQSLLLRQELKDKKGEALTLLGIGRTYAWQGKSLEALDYLNRSLQIIQGLNSKPDEADILSGLGWVYIKLNDYDKAFDYFQKALPLRVTAGDRAGEATTLFGITKCKRQKGDLSAAKIHLEDALDLLEALRSSGESCQLRLSYFAEVQEYYDFYINLLMQLHQWNPTKGYAATALQASEFARARSLIDLLNEANVDIRQAAPINLISKERELQQRLNDAAYRQRKMRNTKLSFDEAEALQKEISHLTEQHDGILANLREASPEYAALKHPQILQAAEIQSQLDEGTLLLEYALGKEQSFLWAVTKDSLKNYELRPRQEIDAQARRVYELLTVRNERIKDESEEVKRERVARANADFDESANKLSQMLLGQVESLHKAKRLVIAAQGILQLIPFSVLPMPDMKTTGVRKHNETEPNHPLQHKAKSAVTGVGLPLIVSHEVINIPSVSAIALQRSLTENRQLAPKMIAIFADPVFSRNDERVKGSNTTLQVGSKGSLDGEVHFTRLSATRWEAEEIMKLAPEGQGLLALDFAANRLLATSEEMKNYRILHFATHSFVNDDHPELSEIALSSVNQEGQYQDGSLMAHELFKIKLPADLIVLSACKTGLGKDIRGEGLMNLSRMFMCAGAPRVIVSMWSLEDQAAADFMVSFYKKLLGKERLSPSAALRATQAEMWKVGKWKSPIYWGAFALQGDWSWQSSK